MSFRSISIHFFPYFCLILVSFFVSSPVMAATVSAQGKVKIDGGNSVTYDRRVTLTITSPVGATQMMVDDEADFSGAKWESVKKRKSNWYLDYGARSQSVFVRFRFKNGDVTRYIYDTISLRPETPKVTLSLEDDEVSDRYLRVSSTISNGIEGYRYGTVKDLSKQTFEKIIDRDSLDIIVSAGDGKKTVYVDFQDSSGQIIQRTLVLTLKQTGRSIAEGSVLYGQDKKYYYFGYDGRLHMFPNEQVYRSWYPTDKELVSVSRGKIEEYAQGEMMCVRPGTYVVTFAGSAKAYLPEPGCRLRPVRSEAEAYVLYGGAWRTRVLELPSTYLLHYDVVTLDATDEDADLKDRDKDGVSDETEADYGTSDRDDDSDNDGLSDYEEIEYWFSDPMRADSDSDGFRDMQEILNGYSPIGSSPLTELPEDTYTYPLGSVIRPKVTTKKKVLPMYYVRSETVLNSLGTKTTATAFVNNYFQDRFVAEPPLLMTLPKTKGGLKSKEDTTVTQPYTLRNGVLEKL
jgi:hypothetical protein